MSTFRPKMQFFGDLSSPEGPRWVYQSGKWTNSNGIYKDWTHGPSFDTFNFNFLVPGILYGQIFYLKYSFLSPGGGEVLNTPICDAECMVWPTEWKALLQSDVTISILSRCKTPQGTLWGTIAARKPVCANTVLDCSPANSERELGLDRRETG